jgi:hypothetical protein
MSKPSTETKRVYNATFKANYIAEHGELGWKLLRKTHNKLYRQRKAAKQQREA